MNAPVKIQPRESALLMLDLVEALEGMERTPFAIVRSMEIAGAQLWRSGRYEHLRYRGIVGSSLDGDATLVESWVNAARAHLGLEPRS